jgi:hypothetical protein
MGLAINDTEWLARCADRLQHQWPHAARSSIEESVRSLMGESRWRRLAPEVAGVVWLRLGHPAAPHATPVRRRTN